MNRKPLLLGFFLALLAIPMSAQMMSGPSVFGRWPPRPGSFEPFMTETLFPEAHMKEDEACLPWALSQIRGATVSVVRLAVPDKARSEFDKACGDFHKKKMADAEQHVRSAIEKYSNYVAAWVMLGEVLEAQQQSDKAREACEHASTTDPTYLPPYICLAELDARSGKWGEILNVTKTALGLNPVGDLYAYFYRAMALFNLNQLPEAEKSAMEAEGIDREHKEAPVHYLLAQIYEAKGDFASAMTEVRHFLKINRDKQRTEDAKLYLSKLQAHQSGN